MTEEVFQEPPVKGLRDFVRLSGTPEQLNETLGPLADLLGTWVGNHGWNLIAVPKGPKGFQLLINPYIETISFTPIGAPVPDRGGIETLFLTGVAYELRITDAQTNQPLHIENGMWLFMGDTPGSPTIVRQATVPHGNSVLALGTYTVTSGAPVIPDLSALPDPGHGAPLGYLDPYLVPRDGFSASNVNESLQTAVSQQQIVQTTTIELSTANIGGGIVNIPFITQHANASAFDGTFWIETVKNADGTEFQQLQYSQQTNLDFIPKFDDPTQLIMWPHVNVNTLVKQ